MQNPALTNATLHSKASDGVFCKPLQALVLAIVVFFFLGFYNPILRSKASDGVFVNPCKLSACNCCFFWLLHLYLD